MNKDDLHSRRDFFKKSLYTVLPIIGSVVLANPLLSSCSKDDDEDDDGGGSQAEVAVAMVPVLQIVETIVRAMLHGVQHHVMAVVKVLAFLAARHHV